MKKTVLVAAVLALLVGSAAAQRDDHGRNTTQSRSLSGQVVDKSEKPLADAVVYLQNTKSLAVKTFITDRSGEYRFHGLSPNVDYEVYAEHKGQKSGTKTLSAFDSRTNVTMSLKVEK